MWACQQEDSSNVFVILVILVRVAGVSLCVKESEKESE